MSVRNNEDFRAEVETATGSGVYVLIGDMDTFEYSDASSLERHPTFGRTVPYATENAPEIGGTLSGFFNDTDTGQLRLRAAKRAGESVNLRILHDGTNGFRQSFRIGTIGRGASAAGGLQAGSFELAADGDPVIVGAGPLP